MMKKSAKFTNSLKASLLAILVGSAGWLPAIACCPDYPKAVLVSYNHPDLPLKPFADGNLGVIQANWARSYLCVAYRYLAGKPLKAEAKQSALDMWYRRIHSQGGYLFDNDFYPDMSYMTLRREIMHLKEQPDYDDIHRIHTDYGVTDSAFRQALTALQYLIKRYGKTSPAVKTWLKAQDDVFGLNKAKKVIVPAPLPSTSDSTLRQFRQYQIGAAYCYLFEFARAEKIFAGLSGNKTFPYHDLAYYLVERCRVEACQGAGNYAAPEKVMTGIADRAAGAPNNAIKQDILNLGGRFLSNTSTPEENCRRLIHAVSATEDPDSRANHIPRLDSSFGCDLGDLTYYLGTDETGLSKEELNKLVAANDLTDWLATVHSNYDPFVYYEDSDEGRAKAKADKDKIVEREGHALSRYRQTHSLAWLTAAMICGGLKGEGRQDIRLAAEAIAVDSPAYLTASFYLVDAYIAQKQLDEARKRLSLLARLKEPVMPISAYNLFQSQRLVTAQNLDQYLEAACLKVSAASSNDLLVPDTKSSNMASYTRPAVDTFDVEVGRDLDRNLPYSAWLALSRKHFAAANLRARIICATWIRAYLLGKKENLAELSRAMILCYPSCKAKLQAFQSAASESERRYLFGQIILDNYGFSPYVRSGLPRMGETYNQFNYYQSNYWRPLKTPAEPPQDNFSGDTYSVADRGNASIMPHILDYYKMAPVQNVLSPAQKQEAKDDLKNMTLAHPSSIIGGGVLAIARDRAQDKDLPEYLFKVVKMPYWSGDSETGSKFSRQAYLVLHQKFPQNKWAKKAVCWY